MAEVKIDQNYKSYSVKCWKTYSTIWKQCLNDFIWKVSPLKILSIRNILRDFLIHSLEVKGLVYRHLYVVLNPYIVIYPSVFLTCSTCIFFSLTQNF